MFHVEGQRAVLSRTDDFAEAYLVPAAETTGINRIASFERTIDRVTSVERIEAP